MTTGAMELTETADYRDSSRFWVLLDIVAMAVSESLNPNNRLVKTFSANIHRTPGISIVNWPVTTRRVPLV